MVLVCDTKLEREARVSCMVRQWLEQKENRQARFESVACRSQLCDHEPVTLICSAFVSSPLTSQNFWPRIVLRTE